MSQGQRFKFQGSQFQVQTGFEGASPSKAITAITAADPGVISSTAHGFVTGDVVRIQGVNGMVELNNRLVVVDNEVSGTFEMANEDTTNNDTYVSGGYLDEVNFSEFCELTAASQQDGTADEVEVTTICSTGKEFEAGLSDAGTLQMDYNFAPNSVVMVALREAKEAGTELAFKIIFPAAGGTIIMLGTVQASSFAGAVSGAWTGSTTIKLSGAMFVLAA